MHMSHRFTFPVPTDHAPGGWHAAYMEVYWRLFLPYRNDNCSILEIGTDGGGGLRCYEEYFSVAKIVGMDISPAPEGIKNRPRITHGQVDAYSTQGLLFTNGNCPNLRVAIDDGPHTLSSQEFFVQQYPNLLTADGIAIVEDIQEWGHVDHLAKMVPDGFFTMGIDLRRNSGRYDDILLAIWRK